MSCQHQCILKSDIWLERVATCPPPTGARRNNRPLWKIRGRGRRYQGARGWLMYNHWFARFKLIVVVGVALLFALGSEHLTPASRLWTLPQWSHFAQKNTKTDKIRIITPLLNAADVLSIPNYMYHWLKTSVYPHTWKNTCSIHSVLYTRGNKIAVGSRNKPNHPKSQQQCSTLSTTLGACKSGCLHKGGGNPPK